VKTVNIRISNFGKNHVAGVGFQRMETLTPRIITCGKPKTMNGYQSG
jgi:hypothetical protein